MDYRPLADEDVFTRYVRYAFSPERGPDADRDEDAPDPDRAYRGLYEEDAPDADPVTVLSFYTFDVGLRDARLDAGGVSTVATPPEHRHQGHVGDLLEANARELREADHPLAVLWPFDHEFYRQFGWATATHYARWTAAPGDLRDAASERAGQFRPVDPDEWALLDAVHAADAANYHLGVARTEDWWRERVFKSWGGRPYVYLWEDEAGDPGAYLSYTVEDGEEKTLRVQDHAAVDTEAFGHLLRFLADHDSQVGTVTFETAPETDLLDRLPSPDAVTCEMEAGPMVRLVDVEATLEALSYPVDDRLVVGITDPLLPDLAGRYELDVTDGRATCTPVDEMPDAVLDVGSFSQLVVGHRSAAALDAAGAFELLASESVVTLLDDLFPTAPVYLRERF